MSAASLGLRKAGSSVGRCKAGQASTLILRFTVAYSQLSSRRLQVAGTPTFYDLVYWELLGTYGSLLSSQLPAALGSGGLAVE